VVETALPLWRIDAVSGGDDHPITIGRQRTLTTPSNPSFKRLVPAVNLPPVGKIRDGDHIQATLSYLMTIVTDRAILHSREWVEIDERRSVSFG
jgi:hypothetical protein